MTEKVEQKLFDSAVTIEREISLWLKERNHDMRVFSNSFVITTNYNRYLSAKNRKRGGTSEAHVYIKNIETYLTSVQKQFDDYRRLFVLENDGTVVAVSHTEGNDRTVLLPKDTAEQVRVAQHFRGDVYFEKGSDYPLMLVGIPLFSGRYDAYVGLLAIEIRLQGIMSILQTALNDNQNVDTNCGLLLRQKDGIPFLSTCTNVTSVTLIGDHHDTLRLFDNQLRLQDFKDQNDVHVVGVAKSLDRLQWGLVINENYDDVYARVAHSRNRNILIVCLFALVIGLTAYRLARQIVVPLTSLTDGAQQVADGDLDVHLPILKNDEVGFATRVFNDMVVDLQLNHTKLKQLAITDSLTGLVNRKELLKGLLNHFDLYKRYGSVFSILMVDVDHFKKINDSHGHLVGDEVLVRLAGIFLESVRTVDVVGRYGGEEFLVVLTKTDADGAQLIAERIRQSVNECDFVCEDASVKVSVSIGVTKILPEDENENIVIGRADKALYQAKNNGRDQVVCL